jgi:transposase
VIVRQRCRSPTPTEVFEPHRLAERTFAWLGRYRRLSKDYEYLTATSENTIYLAMTLTLLHRLAQAPT